MAQAVNGDLTVGSPGRKLLRFALPIIFINLLQAVYNVADMIIIGHWADAAAMAAVSTGGQVTTVILVVVTAIANGGTTLIGRSFSTGRTDSIVLRAQRAGMDERLSVLGLIFDSVTHRLRGSCELENVLEQLTKSLRELKSDLTAGKDSAEALMERIIAGREEQLGCAVRASSISREGQREAKLTLRCLNALRGELLRRGTGDAAADFAIVKSGYKAKVGELKESASAGTRALDNTFTFCEQAFADGDEVLIFVTELTANYYTARFIGHYGCDKYYLHNKELRFQERRQEIMKQVDSLDLGL